MKKLKNLYSTLILGVVLTSTAHATAILVSISTATNVYCNGGNNGQIYTSVSGSVGFVHYSWSPGTLSDTLSYRFGLTAGTYTVTVTDYSDMTQSQAVQVITEPLLLTVTNPKTDVSCNGLANGSMMAYVQGGTAPYTYSWSHNPSFTAGSVTNLAVGTYTSFITDNNGCTENSTEIISEPPVFTTSISNFNISCFGANDGSAFINLVNGVSPYTHSWTNSETTSTISNLAPGTYSATSTDANGCVFTSSVNITQPTLMYSTGITPTNISCFGGDNGAIALNAPEGGTPPYTYNWSNGATTQNISVLTAGTYTATMMDSRGCIVTANATVISPSDIVNGITINSAGCGTDCNGSASSIISGGTPGYVFNWLQASSIISTSPSISGLCAGSYDIIVTDVNGCIDSSNIVIANDPTPVANYITIDKCLGASSEFADLSTISSGIISTYYWDFGDGATSTVQNPNHIYAVPGTYSITLNVTSTIGCTHSTGGSTNIYPIPDASFTTLPSSICNNSGAINLTPSTVGGVFSGPGITGGTFSPISAIGYDTIVYTLTVSGCTNFSSQMIDVMTAPTINAGADDAICSTDNIQLGATGATTYIWSPGATLSSSTISNPMASPITTTEYTVTGTSANGCTNEDQIIITVNMRPTVNISGQNTICLGDTTLLTASGAITYSWYDGANPIATSVSLYAVPTIPTTYTVYGYAANGCTNYASTFINVLTSSVNGNVILSGNPVNNGIVEIYRVNGPIVEPLFIDSLNANGDYSFSNVTSGNYIIRAIANETTYPFAIPTYVGNVHAWAASTQWIANCGATATNNIDVINLTPSLSQGATVGGVIYDDSDSSGTRSGIRKPGEPIKGVGIIIQRRPGGSAAMRTVSDSLTGVYSFANVANGAYDLHVEMPNGTLVNTYEFNVVMASQNIEDLNFFVDSVSGTIDTTNTHNPDSVFTTSVVLNNELKSYQTKIYPNPIKNDFIVEINSVDFKTIEWTVSDMNGKIIKSTSRETLVNHTLNLKSDCLKHQANGFYFVTIRTADTSKVFKLLKE